LKSGKAGPTPGNRDSFPVTHQIRGEKTFVFEKSDRGGWRGSRSISASRSAVPTSSSSNARLLRFVPFCGRLGDPAANVAAPRWAETFRLAKKWRQKSSIFDFASVV